MLEKHSRTTRRQLLKSGVALALYLSGCSGKINESRIQNSAPTPTPTPTPASIDTKIQQAIDKTNGTITTILEIYAPEKPRATIEHPYTRTLEPKQGGDKWTIEIQQQKPTDYHLTIQAGDQQQTIAIEGLLPQQEYQALASIQDTIDHMYHELLRDQRLGTRLKEKKNTMKKAAQYAKTQTPTSQEAIQATLAIAHATANKGLPENPEEIYNLIKKTSQNPALYNGFKTYTWTDAVGNQLSIHTQNLPEALWLQARTLAQLEKKHGPQVSQKYGHLIGNNTSWWAQVNQITNDYNGGGYPFMGSIDIPDGKQHQKINTPGLSRPRGHEREPLHHPKREGRGILQRGRPHARAKIPRPGR